jgi:hypothetical protein
MGAYYDLWGILEDPFYGTKLGFDGAHLGISLRQYKALGTSVFKTPLDATVFATFPREYLPDDS